MRIIRLEAVTALLCMIETKADFLVLPVLAVRAVSMRIVATGIYLVAELLASTFGFRLQTASDRLELRVVAKRIVGLETISVRLLVIQAEAHGRILPALTV